MTTNYHQTFITVSPDSPVAQANRVPRTGTVAALQLGLLLDAPYGRTSDDLLFEVHAMRHGIGGGDRWHERSAFDAKAKACLRASPLVKTHGWGLHHDEHGRVAAIAVDDPAYARLAADPALKVVAGMRNGRAAKGGPVA
jgi:hypothetical protein